MHACLSSCVLLGLALYYLQSQGHLAVLQDRSVEQTLAAEIAVALESNFEGSRERLATGFHSTVALEVGRLGLSAAAAAAGAEMEQWAVEIDLGVHSDLIY